ncbi:glycosyltransferase [Vandammella animalimorsus]|uniref:glycosyltransferase n=1 Tax=Vandammella animalimorsus TaxID=2029117 RepID=UPI0031BA735F
MKSLLIVTEQFTLGGLETHIRGEIEYLSKAGVTVHLAAGKAFEDALLPAELTSITHGLPLGPEHSLADLLSVIHHLRQIIRQHAIGFIHVHPFTSIIPAVVAAELESIPYAITLHGPASMASYGPIYDLLFKDIILPSAPLIIAVSPEVQDLLTVHASEQSVHYIPNSVTFEESPSADSTVPPIDPRWLVVSRLDEFKVQGIFDFCSKAKLCGIPGVVIAGDGPAKQQLCQMLEEHGQSDYVELIGSSNEIPTLIQKFSGIAGMGRVVLEGISSRKLVILVGYDGVKGVVDEQLLAKAAEHNFSGRNLPVIDSNELLNQLGARIGKDQLDGIFEFTKKHFNAHHAWTRFLDKISSIPAPAATLLTGLHHHISTNTITETTPYLYSKTLLDRIEAVVCSKKFYNPRLLAAVSLCRQRQVSNDVNLAVAERDSQIASLNLALSERDAQTASLNQMVAEHDVQTAHLNQALTERDEQLAKLNKLVAERDGQILGLNQVLTERDAQLANINYVLAERDGQLANLNRTLTERDGQLVKLNELVAERDGQLAKLNKLVAERDGQLDSLDQLIALRDTQLVELQQMLAEHEEQLDSLKDLVAQRDERLASINQTAAEREGQLASLDLIVAERDGQLAALNHAVTERDGQLASLQQLIAAREAQLTQIHNEADSLFARLEQILSSRSWRYTRPLRATARIFKHGTPYADGHQYLYNFAARIGRTLPFPMALKARVRKWLLERLYPSTAQPAHPEPQNQVARPILQGGEVLPASMSAERCGLVEGLVSVVLPVYNQADLIAESIDSVLNQTYQNFELIIVNDGSSDGLGAVLDRYRDHPKIRCFQQENQRLPKALSNGFSLARGEFWTWTSADNLMEPRMLELLVKRLQADPALGMVYADYYAIDDRGALLQDPNWRSHNRPDIASGEIRLPRTTEALNVVQDNFIGPCFMYRGWIGRCLGDYDPQLGVEDYDYWMRINALFTVAHLGDESLLYRYRVHDNTLSAKAHEHKILEKVQRLMIYERERAAFYSQPMTYDTDSGGHVWLSGQGVAETDIATWGPEKSAAALTVMTCSSAIGVAVQLLQSMQPVAVILNDSDTDYHKLHQLLNSGKCIVLAEDRISAERVRLLSLTCPVVDIRSGMVLAAIRAFTKNLQFFRGTRTAEELKREAPQQMLGLRRHHVVLQVDSFTQGGMENVVIDLALSLQSNEYQVSIVNFGKSGDAATKAIEQGLRVVSLSSDLPDDAYRSWLISNNVNLVNAHYSIRGAAVCNNAGIPFIQTIHNSYVWLDPVLIEKYREADRYTTEYICVSMTAARYADVTLGLSVSKMRVIPNGIDPNAIDAANFEINRSSLRNTWGVSDETPVFLNVASIMATKAQLPLVKAFAQVVEKVPDARLVLLGSVMEESYHAAIEKAIQELGLQKNVLLAGYDRHVSRYYHAADVFVLPSYWEGWSLSLGEAMANGLACVITDVGSAYEFSSFDGVEITEPPFGDIALLNYRNLGSFVYSDDPNFQRVLAESMSRVLGHRRKACNVSLASKLDRKHAYQKYMHAFRNYL